MSSSDAGGYGFYSDRSGPEVRPDARHIQTRPQDWTEDTGVYIITITHPPMIQRGSTIRFRFRIKHIDDGVINTLAQFTTPLAASMIDRYRQPALAGYFTVGAVSVDPSFGNCFYSDVLVMPQCELDFFEIRWTGAYTPNAGPPAKTFTTQRGFRVIQPAQPGKHFFVRTDQYGAK